MKNNLKDIAKNLQKKRKSSNTTLEDLSFSTNISYNSIWNMENGIDFKMSTFIKLCNYYKIDINKLFDDKIKIENEDNFTLSDKQLKKLLDFLKSLNN